MFTKFVVTVATVIRTAPDRPRFSACSIAPGSLLVAARAATSSDPVAMLQALNLGLSGAVLMTVATVTTNFVNIYMSSLALRSLVPKAGDQVSVWSTGLIAAALSLFSGAWLDRYASFMLVLDGI